MQADKSSNEYQRRGNRNSHVVLALQSPLSFPLSVYTWVNLSFCTTSAITNQRFTRFSEQTDHHLSARFSSVSNQFLQRLFGFSGFLRSLPGFFLLSGCRRECTSDTSETFSFTKGQINNIG